MTKSGKIREFVRAHPGASRDAIAAGTKLDASFVSTVCAQRVKKGEFVRDEAGGYSLNAEYRKGAAATGRAPKKTKKSRGFMAARRARKKRKGGGRAPSVAPVAAVSPAQRHVQTTFAVLAELLDLEGSSSVLVAAFQAHREALEMARG